MDKVIEFLHNSWFVGIVGGIISGIIVFFITNIVTDRKKKIDYKRNVVLANNDIMDVIRPYIANSEIPESNHLQAIINSVSRKYGVQTVDLKNVKMLYEDLIYEFVGNPYISSDIKKSNISVFSTKIENISCDEVSDELRLQQKEKSTFNGLATVLGVISAIITSISSIVLALGTKDIFSAVIIACIIIICLTSIISVHMLTKRKKYQYFSKYWPVEHFKMVNHGTDLDSLFSDERMNFVNYFEEW